MNTTNIQAVLFDLDGTLLDTAGDLALALNNLRLQRGLAALSYDEIRPFVSHGAAALVRLGFPNATDSEFADLRQGLLDFYAAELATHTRPFPGMDPVLATLEERGVLWGVVTNKPAFLTQPLLKQLQLHDRCACIVSGDTLAVRKPHPEPLLHAARLIQVPPQNCVYVGDAERDIQAGRAAGMLTLVATFGYLGEEDRPGNWQADGMIATPQELLSWLAALNKSGTSAPVLSR